MPELGPLEWDLDGLALGYGTPYAVLDTEGLEDSADVALTATDNHGDGQTPGHARMTDRLVSITLGFHSAETLEEDKDALRAVLSLPVNRYASKVLRWRHRPGEETVEAAESLTKRVHWRPASGRPLRIPGNYDHLVHGFADAVQIRLQVDDPVIYSDALTEVEVAEATPGSATEFEVTNAGSLAAVSCAPPGSTLGAYQFALTAGDAGCTWPFLRNVDHEDEFVYLAEELGADAVFSVSWDRVARRNTTVRWSQVKGPNTSPIPYWPVIRPGVNTFEFGCTAGSVTGTFEYRSTW